MPEDTATLPKKRMTEERWLELFKEWQASGESQESFCKRKGMNYHTFVYWRTKHNSKQKNQESPLFAKARIAGSVSSSATIRIILTSGVQIVIPANYDKAMLSDLLHMVGVIQC